MGEENKNEFSLRWIKGKRREENEIKERAKGKLK